MFGMLLNFLSGGFVDKIASAYIARTTATTEVDKAEIAASVEEVRAKIELLKLEQGNWITRSIRPLFAAPFIIYYWAVVVFGYVLDVHSVPSMAPQIELTGQIIVAAYFVSRVFEKRR
jgi:hypothetical protein